MLISSAKGNVHYCAMARNCQLWLGGSVSSLKVSFQTSPVLATTASDTPQQIRKFS
jgi:hypothetical protein